jgi:3-deoxy-D-manno-octulosonate 8-phosphate phosphatase KdsC-like HAD superfamily phosphatase
MLINPIDLLKNLKTKDHKDFQDMALIVADYIQETPGNEEAYREIIDLICEPQSGLTLVKG